MFYTHIAAALLGLVIGASAGWQYRDYKALQLETAREDSSKEQQRLANASRTRIDYATQTAIEAARRTAVVDRGNADLVREYARAIAARPAASGPSGCADEHSAVGVLAGLIEEVAGVVAQSKASTDELGAQTVGLQGYVRAECAAQP